MSFISQLLDFISITSSTEEDNPNIDAVFKSGAIGAFGDIVFEVSTFRVLTFDDFKRTTKARIATHEIIGKTPISEFLGQDVETITLKIQLHADLGVNPWNEYTKLLDMCRVGEPNYLIIATHACGRYKWLIKSVSKAVKHWGARGSINFCECDVSFKEYARG